MKVIIEHDDYCNASAKGKESWLRAFENMRAKTAKGFDQIESMKKLCEEWAELARASDHCICGAAEEIEKREKEKIENTHLVPVE